MPSVSSTTNGVPERSGTPPPNPVSPYPRFDKTAGAQSNLFKPIQVGNLKLDHRIVLAPLTRYRAPNHVSDESAIEYYGQRAHTPGTFLITEATFISAKAGGMRNVPGIYNDAQSAIWKKIFTEVHRLKSFVYVQLWALGNLAVPDVLREEGQDYVSASATPKVGGGEVPRALTVAEIKEYIQDYADAAKRAIDAGADGVEIHAANHYLLNQFLDSKTNHRTDEYGGSIENRSRFLLEVVDKVVETIGADRVGIRLSPWRAYDVSPLAQFSHVVTELERRAQAGNRLAYIHVVEPRVIPGNTDALQVPTEDVNSFIGYIWKGPIIRAGGLIDLTHDVANIDDRTLVGIGRYFISNPDFVHRIKQNRPLTKYNRSTFYWDGEYPIKDGYTDYAFDAE